MSSLAGWQTRTIVAADVRRLAAAALFQSRLPTPPVETGDSESPQPTSLEFLGFDWRTLNASLSVSFGGTLSPCTDAYQLSILLAQTVIENADARDAIVVSGGGRGVDMAAHLGALDVGGKTIAVLANPVAYGLHPYIPRRALLERSILAHRGGFVSEYTTYVDDYMKRAVHRGGTITALSDMFIAIECSSESTTVDCAMRAKAQNRAVVAIDWSKFRKLHHPAKTTGFETLVAQGIAEPFPAAPVSSITDPELRRQFQELLHTVAGFA
jgi:hypothetical protein